MQYRKILETRLKTKKFPIGFLDVTTNLAHFSLVNYALPSSRLKRYIPEDRFEISEFIINGKPMALMSAVSFLDLDFNFRKFFPFLKFRFPQTNYRVYVKDKITNEPCVWFFGTTLGSYYVYIARLGFKIPWYFANYNLNCEFILEQEKYKRYSIQSKSSWASSDIDLEDTGIENSNYDGFSSLDEMKLILTHPITGFFYRTDLQLGTYKIWHKEIRLTQAIPRKLYFSLFERLELLTRDEMENPFSALICPKIQFDVYLPPARVIN